MMSGEQSELELNLSDIYEFQEFFSLKIVVAVIKKGSRQMYETVRFPISQI